MLTIGTLIDNGRHLFGAIDPANNAASLGLTWFLELNHEVICCCCPAVGLQLISVANPMKRDHIRWLAATCVVIFACFCVGLFGFVAYTAPKGMEIDDYFGVHTASPEGENPLALFCIIVTCVVALAASVMLSCARGWNEWGWLVVCQLLGIAGQSLLSTFNAGYAFYGSNFWEQVTIFSLVIADGVINEDEKQEKEEGDGNAKLLMLADSAVIIGA